MSRILCGEELAVRWQRFASLDDAFALAPDFTHVPTVFLVLPTASRWTVLWNNGSSCSGYDALCANLTANHGLTTVAWLAHDAETTTEPGAIFNHRRRLGDVVARRTLHVLCESGRWSFFASGEPLPEEDSSSYAARRKRDRLNETSMSVLLARLGASPWSEDWYDLASRDAFVLERREHPASFHRRSRAEVLARR